MLDDLLGRRDVPERERALRAVADGGREDRVARDREVDGRLLLALPREERDGERRVEAHALGLLRLRLDEAGVTYEYLDGKTRDRGERVERFSTDPACRVFLISLKAGGVGLTLTEADYVFVLDPWWNPAVEAQAVDRTHRIGQQRPVNVYRLVATDTIEQKVMELKARKAALFAQVVDGDALMAAPLGADDVRALFAD